METELKSFAQVKLTQNEIMKNIADPAKSGERQDKNFRMVMLDFPLPMWERV